MTKYEELVKARDVSLKNLTIYMEINGVEQVDGLIQLAPQMYQEARRLYNIYDAARRELASYWK